MDGTKSDLPFEVGLLSIHVRRHFSTLEIHVQAAIDEGTKRGAVDGGGATSIVAATEVTLARRLIVSRHDGCGLFAG